MAHQSNVGAVQAEAVAGLQDIGVGVGTIDLAVEAAPLGLVDGIDPVFDLHDDAAVLLDDARAVGDVVQALGGLEGDGAWEGKSVVVKMKGLGSEKENEDGNWVISREKMGKKYIPFCPPQE
jgi:hypothetical protein